MPIAVYEPNPNRKRKLDTNSNQRIFCIRSRGDYSFSFKLTAAELARSKAIMDCNALDLRGGGDPPDPPWWYIVAKRLLLMIYDSSDLEATKSYVIKFIIGLYSINLETNIRIQIANVEKLKVAHTMVWLHENEILCKHDNHDKFSEVLSHIVKQLEQRLIP